MRIIGFIIFAIIGLSIIFGGNLFIYRSAVKYFSIDKILWKQVLFWAVIFLGFSLFTSMTLAHFYFGWLSRAYYFISVIWLGLSLNLLMSFAAVRMISLVLSAFKISSPNLLFGWLAVLAAVLFSAYGWWNSYNLVVTNLEIKINNLPSYWQNKTIVQLTDLHIGEVVDEDRANKIFAEVNKLDPDLILFTGDYFDGPWGDLNKLAEPLKNLQAKNGIYFVNGNHEIYSRSSRADELISGFGVKILKDKIVEINDLQIIGVDYKQEGQKLDLSWLAKSLDKNKPAIVMYHEPRSLDIFEKLGIDLLLVGHTHNGQVFPASIIAQLVYKGFASGYHEIGDMKLYVSRGLGTWGPPMRTSGRPEIVRILLKQ